MNRLIIFIALLLPTFLFAKNKEMDSFTIKESLINKHRISVIALDSTENPKTEISGLIPFQINGFGEVLNFNDGVATSKENIASSTFVFLRYKGVNKSKGRLFYIYKTDSGLTPIAISGLMFVIIPAVILGIAYMFKKVIMTVIGLAISFFLFNHSAGLDLGKIFQSIFASIQNLIQ